MSDARWFDVDADIESAVTHFTRAAELFRTRDMKGDALDAYMARMAFMHAVMAGHTSREAGLNRIFRLLDEESPSGETWHADLIRADGTPDSRSSCPRKAASTGSPELHGELMTVGAAGDVIASEAIQGARRGSLDCFVASLLAMTG